MQLTSSQMAALALDKNISVTAGAGSGKTRILVDRFLKIATENPVLTRHIVAITFTEKAAAEMQERIAEEVNNRLQKEHLNPADRKKLQIIRDQLSSAHISTIHGFCMRILQEFPVEASITPDFSILDPIRQQVLMHSAIQSTLEVIDKKDIQNIAEEWFDLFMALPRRRIWDMLKIALEKPYELQKIAVSFREKSKDEFLKFLTDKWLNIYNTLITTEEIQKIFLLSGQIIENSSGYIKNKKGQELYNSLKLFIDSYSQNPASLKACGYILQMADGFTKTDGEAYKNLTFLGKKESWGSPENQKRVMYLSEHLALIQQRVMQKNPGSPPDTTDEKWYDLFHTFLKLHDQVQLNFQQIKEDQGVLDFEDLQLITLKLLQENDEIRQSLQKRFRYIMVDEFQDTNPVQWQIVEKLTTVNGKISQDQNFIVGDPKQSIYGFRDADIRIFKNVLQTFSQNAGHMFEETYKGNITFRESFRFLPQINAFINHFFSQILKPEDQNPFEVRYEQLHAQRNVPGKGNIELTVLDEGNPNQSEAEYMALRIKDLFKAGAEVYQQQDGLESARPIRYGDIAILIRDRSSLSDIEHALRSNDIPFKTVGGIGFWQRQEIYDIYHVLRFLSNPTDDLALIAILRSRLFLLADNIILYMSDNKGFGYLDKLRHLQNDIRLEDSEKELVKNSYNHINKWLNLRERLTLSEILNIILEDTRLFTLLNAEYSGEQRTANLQKVIELADSFDQSGPGGMRSFLAIIDDLINREVAEGEAFLALDDQTTVKIMTIHVSKGLQFPVVFTPYLNRSIRGPGNDVLLDSELGMAVTFKNEDDAYGDNSNENTLYRLLRVRQKQKDLAETKRIFYVAVSRASDYLFLSASVKGQKSRRDSMFNWFNNCLISDGKSAYFPGKVSFRDFELTIVTEYDSVKQYDNSSKNINHLIDELNKPQPEDTVPIEVAQPIETQSRGRTFSATSLMTFVRDPDAYYRHYHLGFFEGDYEQNLIEKTDDIDSLLKGKIVHRFLELNTVIPDNPAEICERILFDFEIYDDNMKEQLTKELLAIYKHMQESDHGKKILEADEFKNEVSLTMQLGEDFFTGTIDRIQKNNENEWEIYDYKTNRITADEIQSTAEKYEIQIKSYALLLSQIAPGQKFYTISFYFISVDSVFLQKFSLEEITSIKSEFQNIINTIKRKFPVNQVE